MTLRTPEKKILLIEDDAKTARAVCAGLLLHSKLIALGGPNHYVARE
jgi:hypothetical protein